MLGISVYLSKENVEFNRNWIKKASENGFSSIFTSLHIPEENPELYKEQLYNIGREAKNYKMRLFVDIAPHSLEYIGLNPSSAGCLREWGVTGLRADYGFGVNEIVKLSHLLNVCLNASTLTKEFLDELIHSGLNVENTTAIHNFYPRPETGLGKEYFVVQNRFLKNRGIDVAAFIAGDGIKRQPLYKGLPTLESHRYVSPVEAYLELTKSCYVDHVFVGDLSLSEETLTKMSFLKKEIIPIRFHAFLTEEYAEVYDFLNSVQRNRPDPARDVVRIENSRLRFHNNQKVLEPNNTVERKKGSVTIDNLHYGRYAGEIHIALKDLPADPCVNVIGQVTGEDLPLLHYIDGGTQFLLIKV